MLINKYDKVLQRIGRLKEKYAPAAQYYDIAVTKNNVSGKANTIQWTRLNKPHSRVSHPDVYCLRTNQTDWDEATLWRTYTMLTDLEAVFRSLKSELGLRPIYHQKEKRVNGHIFITLLAYHVVQTLRTQLKAQNIHQQFPLTSRHKANKATERSLKIDFRKLLPKLQYDGSIN